MLPLSLRCASIAAVAFALAVGCGGAPPPPAHEAPAASGHCDATQARISREADERVRSSTRTGAGFERHVATNFVDHKVSWLMREDAYQKFVVQPNAQFFGRCDKGHCYQFAAPAATIRKIVADATRDGKHDPAAMASALGLPPSSFEGTVKMVTLDLDAAGVCARLPVEDDPGSWKCKGPDDKACFQFGGFTSGGVPEAMLIDAPVAKAAIETIP